MTLPKLGEPALGTDVGAAKPKSRRLVKSVERALGLLELLAASDGKLRLNTIAQRMGLNVSTCHHLLSTLVEHGYVGHAQDRTYFLGNKILELSGSHIGQFNLVEAAMTSLRALNEKTGETIHLAALQGDEMVTLTILESHHPVRVISGPGGKSEALHATATGKAILAWLPEREVSRILDRRGMGSFTEATITDRDALIEELRLVRRNGYAIDLEEFQAGVVCVGAAIRDQAGAVVGAFSCSMPGMRATDEYLQDIRADVVAAAAAISAALAKTVADAGDIETEYDAEDLVANAS
jgi:IclR family acetate operon transcriptional repressor